jgi:chemotaxis protein MotB
MKSKIKTKPVDASGRNWLLPFNDMMTLLLTFFVLLLSISKVDATKVQTASTSVIEAFGVTPEAALRPTIRVFDPFIFPSEDVGNDSDTESSIQEKPWGSTEDWKGLVRMLNAAGGTRASFTEKGIEANFSENLFFRPGEVEPATTEPSGFQPLLEALRKTDVMVRVEDHTADTPLDLSRYAASWELSTARAARIAEMLKQKGIAPRRLSISGYGDSRILMPGRKSERTLNRIDLILTFNRN